MSTKLQKALLAVRQLQELIIALHRHIKSLSGIHCKLIHHNLAKKIEILICFKKRFYGRLRPSLPEILVYNSSSRIDNHAHRNHKHSHKSVDYPNVDVSQHTYQRLMHPAIAIGSSRPFLFFCHYPNFDSI